MIASWDAESTLQRPHLKTFGPGSDSTKRSPIVDRPIRPNPSPRTPNTITTEATSIGSKEHERTSIVEGRSLRSGQGIGEIWKRCFVARKCGLRQNRAKGD
ncbi:unnamed protein product, partial [Musa acuminata var. zebrina]